jgi:hypothetical protein
VHFDKTGSAGYHENTMTFTSAIPSRRGIVRRFIPGLVLILVSTTLLACQSSIEVVQPAARSAVPVATIAPFAHAMAIMCVDFDPSLDYSEITSNGGVTLLVAIKNLGLTTEPKVQVKARLLDPVDPGKPVELLNEAVIAKSLSPGEVRVVHFTQVSDLPLRQRYKLEVELAPVPGERDLSDNSRSYDILVHGAE